MKIKIFSILVVIMLLVSLFGCSNEIKSITDFDAFSTMSQDNTDRIDVVFDNNSGQPFNFSITKKEDIDEIMEILFKAEFENKGSEMIEGDNTILKIIQGENQYNIHFIMNKEGKNYYAFTTNDLQETIRGFATNADAYDIE